jgi:hypothetical protein
MKSNVSFARLATRSMKNKNEIQKAIETGSQKNQVVLRRPLRLEALPFAR